jgi:hypothetical protein
VVGNGSPEQAADFVETTKFPSTLYTDPSRASYRGFGLERGVGRTLGPASLVRGTVAFFSGHRQTALAGDPWQQGGTFVISPPAEVLFAHRDGGSGDHPAVESILKACGL